MNEFKDNKNKIVGVVEKAIAQGKIKMKPKAYFTLKTIALSIGFFALFFAILILTSFIAFSVRARGVLLLPQFGFRGVAMFFASLPWLLIALAVLLFLALEMLARKFALVYRRAIVYSALFFIVLSFLGAFIIDRTNMHDRFFERARMNQLPIAGPVYRSFALCDDCSFHRGVIIEVLKNGFILEGIDKNLIKVKITDLTKLRGNFELEQDREVMVIGAIKDNTIEAVEISGGPAGAPRRIFFAPPQPLQLRMQIEL